MRDPGPASLVPLAALILAVLWVAVCVVAAYL